MTVRSKAKSLKIIYHDQYLVKCSNLHSTYVLAFFFTCGNMFLIYVERWLEVVF